jgi:hypothetical protein
MKMYLLRDEDFDAILAAIDRDPRWDSSSILTAEGRKAHDDAHRFYNYHLRTWIEKVKK